MSPQLIVLGVQR